MRLSAGFRITVSLLILLPTLWGSDSCPGGIDALGINCKLTQIPCQVRRHSVLIACTQVDLEGFFKLCKDGLIVDRPHKPQANSENVFHVGPNQILEGNFIFA